MDNITMIFCGVAFLILVGVYKLGYYIGHNDGIEEGAQMVLNVASELWEKLMELTEVNK